ncbi:MAG: hypothetical protein R3F59_14880 [Myxococcota bacterium]
MAVGVGGEPVAVDVGGELEGGAGVDAVAVAVAAGDEQVLLAVAVEVARAGHRAAELVGDALPDDAVGCGRQLHRPRDGPVDEVRHASGVAVAHALGRADPQVGLAVAVDVARDGDGVPRAVVLGLGVDLGPGRRQLHRPRADGPQDVDRAGGVARAVVVARAHRDVLVAVAREVGAAGHGEAGPVVLALGRPLHGGLRQVDVARERAVDQVDGAARVGAGAVGPDDQVVVAVVVDVARRGERAAGPVVALGAEQHGVGGGCGRSPQHSALGHAVGRVAVVDHAVAAGLGAPEVGAPVVAVGGSRKPSPSRSSSGWSQSSSTPS